MARDASKVITDQYTGLLFKSTRDRKVINVDPKVCSWGNEFLVDPHSPSFSFLLVMPSFSFLHERLAKQQANPGDNTTRTTIKTTEYMQCVMYDHVTRRKA